MALTQKQQQVLIGLLLGDGSLEFNGYRGTRLQVKQREDRGEYVNWLFEQFSDVVLTPPQQRRDTQQWYFGTRYLVEFEEFRKIFYRDGRKVVPENIADFLKSPITLAVWFMDDGTLDYRVRSHYAFSLSTDSFTYREVEYLKEALEQNFGVSSSIQTPSSRGTKYVKLYIGKGGRDQFLKIIRPYIMPCFAYKIPPQLDPSETELIGAR